MEYNGQMVTDICPIAASTGAYPQGPVVIGADGVLYGTTYLGGTYGAGTVFSLTPLSSPGVAWTIAVLYEFTGGKDGAAPESQGETMAAHHVRPKWLYRQKRPGDRRRRRVATYGGEQVSWPPFQIVVLPALLRFNN